MSFRAERQQNREAYKLNSAVIKNAINLVAASLTIEGMPVNGSQDHKRVPLVTAVEHERFEIAKMLLLAGADPNKMKVTLFKRYGEEYSTWESPLSAAITLGYTYEYNMNNHMKCDVSLKFVKLLLSFGAQPEMMEGGEKLFQEALRSYCNINGNTLIKEMNQSKELLRKRMRAFKGIDPSWIPPSREDLEKSSQNVEAKLIRDCCAKRDNCSFCLNSLVPTTKEFMELYNNEYDRTQKQWLVAVMHRNPKTDQIGYEHCVHLICMENNLKTKTKKFIGHDEYGNPIEWDDPNILKNDKYICPVCRQEQVYYRDILRDISYFRAQQEIAKQYFDAEKEMENQPEQFESYLKSLKTAPTRKHPKVTHIFRCPTPEDTVDIPPPLEVQSGIEPQENQSKMKGYVVSQTNWEQFNEYINSMDLMLLLEREELLELCHSLNNCQNYSVQVGGSDDKSPIAAKLMARANDILKQSNREKFVPTALATLYCSNPKMYCIQNVPQDVSDPNVSPSYLNWRRIQQQG